LALLVDGAVQVVPAAMNGDVSLIHTPRSADRSCETVPALLELGHVSNHPYHDGGVGNGDAGIGHQLDEIAIRQSIADVPAHAQFDDLGVEAAPAVDRVTRDRPGHRGLRSKTGTILCEARGCNRTVLSCTVRVPSKSLQHSSENIE